VLFPIRADYAVMNTTKAWAAELRRTRHIGDFTCWKDNDCYQKAFERLLRDLKAGEAPFRSKRPMAVWIVAIDHELQLPAVPEDPPNRRELKVGLGAHSDGHCSGGNDGTPSACNNYFAVNALPCPAIPSSLVTQQS